MLVLGDPGRMKEWASANKPEGSVHGDSVGVHASDAANGWRHIAKVASPRNTFASLIAAAYHTAGQSGRRLDKPYPLAEDVEKVDRFPHRFLRGRTGVRGLRPKTDLPDAVVDVPHGQSHYDNPRAFIRRTPRISCRAGSRDIDPQEQRHAGPVNCIPGFSRVNLQVPCSAGPSTLIMTAVISSNCLLREK